MNDSTLRTGRVVIRQMEERDLHEADRIMRLTFGTCLGLPDPMAFMGDGDYVRTRWPRMRAPHGSPSSMVSCSGPISVHAGAASPSSDR